MCRPEMRTASRQQDGADAAYLVVATPVQEVEVVVIQELRGVQHPLWLLRQHPAGLLHGPGCSVLGVQDTQVALVAGWGCRSLPQSAAQPKDPHRRV